MMIMSISVNRSRPGHGIPEEELEAVLSAGQKFLALPSEVRRLPIVIFIHF